MIKVRSSNWKFRLTATNLILLSLVGCQTPSSVQRVSDYEICRLSLLRPPLQTNAVISEADRQVSARGVNCAAYAGTIFQQQQQGLQQLQQGMTIPPQRQKNSSQSIVRCIKLADKSRQVFSFNAVACPVGYAPSY
jgi:hypothetical protein